MTRGLDIFGHQLNLTLDSTGGSHGTLLGAIISAFVSCVIVAILAAKSYRISNNLYPDITSFMQPNHESVDAKYPLHSLGMLNFYALHKQSGLVPFLDTPDLDRFVSLYFVDSAAFRLNFTSAHSQTHKAVKCTQDHFGTDDQARQWFQYWNRTSIVCIS